VKRWLKEEEIDFCGQWTEKLIPQRRKWLNLHGDSAHTGEKVYSNLEYT